MLFRAAVLADIPAMTEIRLAAEENILRDRGVLDATANNLTANGRGWVCESDGRVVGFCIALNDGSIWGLFINAAYAGRGIGGRLLKHSLNWLKEKGVEKAFLTTSADSAAAAIYFHWGWRDVGRKDDGQIKFEYPLLAGPSAPLEQPPPVCNKLRP